MPLRYVSVEKETTFQGRTERWSNVYCYNMPTVTVAAHEAIQDSVLAAERLVHINTVKFVRTRVFTTDAIESFGDGTMYSVMERNVLGTMATSGSGLYKECAILVKWPLPRKTKIGGGLGRQRSLKKWIHSCGGPILGTSATGQDPITSTEKAPYLTYASSVRTPTGGTLVTASDSAEPSDVARVQDYMEHRQFPRGRKEGLL